MSIEQGQCVTELAERVEQLQTRVAELEAKNIEVNQYLQNAIALSERFKDKTFAVQRRLSELEAEILTLDHDRQTDYDLFRGMLQRAGIEYVEMASPDPCHEDDLVVRIDGNTCCRSPDCQFVGDEVVDFLFIPAVQSLRKVDAH